MKARFDKVSMRCSKLTTNAYSTSFSLGISLLSKKFRHHVCNIYGFVRFADEIVDSFHDYDKQYLLDKFKADTHEAIENRISLNPILNSFQHTVHAYNIDIDLVDTFLKSMDMDLRPQEYNQESFEEYILGSAEVVGLMCLCIFTEGDQVMYDRLKGKAMKLGSAFQKINFLRDLHADYVELGRSYFPGVNVEELDQTVKEELEVGIEADFKEAYEGILALPKPARFGVYMAYMYYYSLFKKIKRTEPNRILKERIRIPNQRKYTLLLGSYIRHSLNLIWSVY